MNLRDTYNRIAEDWHKDHQGDDWWVEETDRFTSFLLPGASVLDAGCGGGTKAKYLAEKGFRVMGVDFSENLVAIAKREVSNAQFQVLDLRNIEEFSGEFDGIFMQAVLLHFPKSEAFSIIQKISAKLKSGGIFYVSVKEQRQGQAEEAILREDDYGYSYERFFSYYTQEEIEDYFRQLHLEVVSSQVSRSGKTGWIQVIGKKTQPIVQKEV